MQEGCEPAVGAEAVIQVRSVPGRGGAGQSGLLPQITTTGHGACCTQCWLTEPRSASAKPPCPRLPTIGRPAPADDACPPGAAGRGDNCISWRHHQRVTPGDVLWAVGLGM